MPPGKYPHLVTIEAPESVQDVIGNWELTFAELCKAYASIEPLRGREYWAAAQMQSEITHEIKMRPPGVAITSACEIVFGTRRFEIEVVRNIGERNRELVILCKEKERNDDHN
jgi:SPP1 family predicted phage head-tail adaptor